MRAADRVGRTLEAGAPVGERMQVVRERGADVIFTAIRRQGILGREPSIDTQLRDGDIVVLYGLPVALEHAEAVLLAGDGTQREAAAAAGWVVGGVEWLAGASARYSF